MKLPMKTSKKPKKKLAPEDTIQLRPESEWENENRQPTEKAISAEDLSEIAIQYLAQIQDLQEQLEQEYLKVQRLEMAIKGFSIALQEEIEKGQ